MIAMVSHSQSTFDQIGHSLGGPQLCPVSVGHGPLGQETNEPFFLFRAQSGWPARCRLGFQCLLPTRLQGIGVGQSHEGKASASGTWPHYVYVLLAISEALEVAWSHPLLGCRYYIGLLMRKLITSVLTKLAEILNRKRRLLQ